MYYQLNAIRQRSTLAAVRRSGPVKISVGPVIFAELPEVLVRHDQLNILDGRVGVGVGVSTCTIIVGTVVCTYVLL